MKTPRTGDDRSVARSALPHGRHVKSSQPVRRQADSSILRALSITVSATFSINREGHCICRARTLLASAPHHCSCVHPPPRTPAPAQYASIQVSFSIPSDRQSAVYDWSPESMLRVGRVLLAEVNDAARRSGLRRLGRAGHSRLMVSAFQTQAKRASPHDAEIRELMGRLQTSMGVAAVGAVAALSLGWTPEQERVAHSRSAHPLTLPAPAYHQTDRRKPWHLYDEVGTGSFGTVRIGMREDSGEVAAVKIVELDYRSYATLEREISAMKTIKAVGGHPGIVGLQEVYVEGRQVYLVMELVKGGELFDHIVAYGAFDEAKASAVAKDIGEALRFMHQHGLVHRDIKPENILLTAKHQEKSASVGSGAPIAKLADFGSAGPLNVACALDDIGTSAYLPPELLSSGACTPACDMWALGCVLYISLCGSHPFDLDGTASDEEVEDRVKRSPVTFDFPAWKNISSDAKDLITKLLEKDPSRRLTADQMLAHPWITAYCGSQPLVTSPSSSMTSVL
ncbi:hypothetical protein PINS_up014047 [Pythium insidiosum]|nr:hypothetical protein PINS_up014047 [Pythium insidiosum]